ncbi:hypothetical protein HYALB_00011522 [Hymenoscyphus albidus]|uniref:Uncharacterized protein n=1 Tax=Hymenoscyphus albidus TaxID=595503 RepID=A0A9N9LTL4_9HELO|nr:hypothetical protein HYALB_00011522 [Hymenoscyphus albidus]
MAQIRPNTNLRWANLDFTQDCTAAADFNSGFWENFDPAHPTFIKTRHAIENFISSALPPGSSKPSTCETMAWFERELTEPNTNVTKRMYQDSFEHCRLETCHSIEYTSNPDISGIGMRAAYCMEAVMVTIYLVIFILRSIQLHRHKPSQILSHSSRESLPLPARNLTIRKWSTRIKNAASQTIGDFLNTAMVFNLSIVVAGIVTVLKSKFRVYDMLQATLVTGFSLSVVLAIWPMQREIKERQMLRNSFLAINMLLSLTEISIMIYIQQSERHTTRKETLCLPQVFTSLSEPSPYFYVLELLVGIAVFMSFWFLLIKSLITKITAAKVGKIQPFEFLWRLRNTWWWIICLYGYFNLWLTLGGLFYVRHLVNTRLNESFEDTSWGFGQVMALATWLPNQADFIYFLIFGVQRGLRVRVTPAWKETYVELEFEEGVNGTEAVERSRRKEEGHLYTLVDGFD